VVPGAVVLVGAADVEFAVPAAAAPPDSSISFKLANLHV
jgi:hypothetical protein